MAIVFVHGITVRLTRFNDLLATVRKGFMVQNANFVVDGCYWGDMASSLRYDGASIPDFISGKRSFDGAAVDPDDDQQLTMLLLDDPLLELRLLKDPEDFEPSGAGFMPLPAGIDIRNQTLDAARRRIAATSAVDAEVLAATGTELSDLKVQALVKDCFDAAGRSDRALGVVELIDPLARAITASLYAAVEGKAPKFDQRFQWRRAEVRVQQLLEVELAGQRGWIGDKLKNVAGGAGSRAVTFAMRHGLRKRIMQSCSLFVGDVLAYMANRDQVQAALGQVITTSLAAHQGPLTLVGHSLGGIICFDYCLRTAQPIERLVTVGSQVGLFAELGVFPTLVPSGTAKLTTPAVVQKWINIYDPNDILSFLAEPILTNVKDIDFNTKSPFPVAHSEYWNQQPLYAQMLQ